MKTWFWQATRAAALAALLLGAPLAVPGTALAEGERVTVRGGEHEGFGRLVFDWPAPVYYTARIEAGYLEIRFDRPAEFDLEPLKRDLEDYLAGSQVSPDRRSLVFNLKDGFALEHFTLGPKVVVDLKRGGLEGIVAGEAPIKVPMPPTPPVRAGAEPPAPVVRVRGGEHADFSRLVFDWPGPVGVRLDRDGRKVRLVFDQAGRFDLSQVTASPLANVTARQITRPDGAREVELELAEGSTAETWNDGPRVVIDVREPRRLAAAPIPPKAPDRPAAPEVDAPDQTASDEGAPTSLLPSGWAGDPLETAAGGATAEQLAALGPDTGEDGQAAAQDEPQAAPVADPGPGTEPAPDLTPDPDPAREPAQAGAPEPEPDASQPTPFPRRPEQPMAAKPDPETDAPSATPPAAETEPGAAIADEPAPGAEEPPAAAAEAAEPPATDAEGEAGAEAEATDETGSEADAESAAGEEAMMPERLEPDPSPLPGRSGPPEGGIALRFNWSNPTAAATFRRGDYVWLVFDRRTKPGLDQRIGSVAPELSPATLDSSTGTVVRLRAPHRLTPRLTADGTSWLFDLRVRGDKPERPLTIVLDNKTNRPRVLVPLVEPGRLQSFIDPDFGDLLFVAPVRAAGQGILRNHDFPEFEILESEQGLVVRPKSEEIDVSMVGKTVALEGPEGLQLSTRKQRETAVATNRGVTPGRRLFDLVVWRRGDLTMFNEQRSRLQEAMLGSSKQRLGLNRLNLARFFFAHGLAPEALGVLELINEENRDLAGDPQVVLLTGATQVLAERYPEAADTLSEPVLSGEPEATLWRAVLAARSGDWAYAAEAFKGTEGLLADYVPTVRHRIELLAAEARIESGDIAGAGVVLGRLRDDRPGKAALAMADYLEGRRLYLEQDYTRTRRLWEAAAESGQPRASVRARLALIDLRLEQGEIEPEAAVDALRQLRFAWRGDSFEFALLERLGELQVDIGEFRDGLDTFRQAISHLPDDPRAGAVAGRMRQVFRELYLGDLGDRLSALHALALYEEFRELTPTGKDGDAVVRELADRLVQVDLLDEAVALLGRQVTYRLAGVEKARVGARVAELDLMNQDPEGAIQALADSIVEEPLPLDLDRRRRFVATRALTKLGHYGPALEALGDDESWDALRLRAAVYWKRRDWASAAGLLEVMLPAQLDAETTPDQEQSEIIIALAIAYSLAEDRSGLADLNWRFGDAMEKTGRKETFDMLTRDLDYGLITSIADELKGVDLIERFLDSYPEDWAGPGAEPLPIEEDELASAAE